MDRNLNQLNVYSQLDHMKNGTCAERKLIDPGDKSIVYAYCRYPVSARVTVGEKGLLGRK